MTIIPQRWSLSNLDAQFALSEDPGGRTLNFVLGVQLQQYEQRERLLRHWPRPLYPLQYLHCYVSRRQHSLIAPPLSSIVAVQHTSACSSVRKNAKRKPTARTRRPAGGRGLGLGGQRPEDREILQGARRGRVRRPHGMLCSV